MSSTKLSAFVQICMDFLAPSPLCRALCVLNLCMTFTRYYILNRRVKVGGWATSSVSQWRPNAGFATE